MSTAPAVRYKYLGHGTFLFTTPGGKTLLVDPWVENNPACPPADKRLDSIDTMLITHGHYDHIQDAVALAKRYRPLIGCIFEISLWLGRKGIDTARPMNKGGTQQINDVRVSMVDARHSCGILEDNGSISYGGEACGYVIEFENDFRVYYAGDTAVFGDMKLIAELYRPDLVFLPIGDLFTMSPKEAAYACRLMGAKRVVPMHFGTFPPLTGTPAELQQLTRDLGTEVLAMRPGEVRSQ